METSQSKDPWTSPSPSPSPSPSSTAAGGDPGCDLVTVPARQGLEAVDILRRGAGDAVGPVLHDDGCGTLGFVVPAGTAAGWDLPGSTCTETDGRGLRLAPEPPVAGSDWLLPPGEADLATDPAVLRRALGEAARLIEAADSRR
ncbi:hypothetical protein D9753_22325 [Streptomyces dangxiongensis]|uniref:Uncharacterized protein n=1 Tax=Streptomyces dangxiongensis TaxID=1442032 RepID=A0A3G2JS29_9ACTN|nr:hypothetical protein [Streptomyces dangxiongensis]AYN43817.1 hypothetical protein D9753_22325 [Streptomyces dangxiongensis]